MKDPANSQNPDGRLLDALSEIIPGDEFGTWLETANPGFAGRRPLDVIHQGESHLIWDMIHQTRQAAYGWGHERGHVLTIDKITYSC